MKTKPNILWIMTDQQKYNTISYLWENCSDAPYKYKEKNLTKNIDSIAKDGVIFKNAYCPSPVCGPARVSIKTGKYPAANGAITNWYPIREDNTYLPKLLQEAGYYTGMTGKLHFFPVDRDYGFDEMHLSDAPYSVYWEDDKHSEYIKWLKANYFDKKGIDPVKLFDSDELAYDSDLKRFMLGSRFRNNEEHETRWTTDYTLEFLDRYDENKPFFYYTSYFGPHQPYGIKDPYNSFIKPEDVVLPDSFYENFLENSEVFKRNSQSARDHVKNSLTEQDCKEVIAAYLCQIKMIDDYIGKIIDKLKSKGIYDDTVIIFCSDHGDHLGEYGMFFKSKMYDSCAKVPLIIKPTGKNKGKIRDEVVNTIDIFKTVLDIAQTDFIPKDKETKENLESKSLLPLLENNEDGWQNRTYSIIGKDKDKALSMIRDGKWKLIRLADGENNAYYEMFDLENDKKEIHDIYKNEEYAEIREKLKELLDGWFAKQYKNYKELEK